MRLKNKIALITGGAKGIGKACAELFAKEGAIVIITDIEDATGENVASSIGTSAHYYHLDVQYETQWQNIINIIKDKFQKLDILVNNAGITGINSNLGLQDPEHATLDSWHKIHAINLDGVFLGCKHAISLMKNNKNCAIVNISSRSGIVGIPNAAAYASSKAAIRNHTKSVALYCAVHGYSIRCNSIHPGAVLTDLWNPMLRNTPSEKKADIQKLAANIPLGTMGEPIDVAYAALYLASNEAKYVTGIELVVDGGILAGSAAAPKPK